MATVMNVAGYAEALEHAIQVDVGGGLVVNVVSIPALAALKILAWNDRGLKTTRMRRTSSSCSDTTMRLGTLIVSTKMRCR